MGDVELNSDEIEKRLGYSMGEVDMSQSRMSPKRSVSSNVSPTRKSGIRRLISPSRSGIRAMRQVSGLGMEDPIFQTNEEGPAHPSNIFSDMGVDDIANDCVDMVSVASDHTADSMDGLDRELFNMSLNNVTAQSPVRLRPSMRDFNPESSLLECDYMMPRMEDTDHSGSTPLQKAAPSRSSIEETVGCQKRNILPSGKKKPSQQTMKAMHLSATSLDLEGVFGTFKAMGTGDHGPDKLLIEAADAAFAQGNSCSELIEAARHQHHQQQQHHAATSTSQSAMCVRRKRSTKNQSTSNHEGGVANNVSATPRPRPRMLPTLSGIFAE